MKLKKGDTVIVITGKDKGKTGTIEAVLPKLNRVVVFGVNKYKKHVKPSPKHPHGGIIELARSMDASNVMILDGNQKPTRVGYKTENNEKVRVAHTTNAVVGK